MDNNELLQAIFKEIKSMKTDTGDLRTDMVTVKDDITSVKADTKRIYGVEKHVVLLNESMKGVTERFMKQDKADEKLDTLLSDTCALREAVKGHSAQPKAIKEALI